MRFKIILLITLFISLYACDTLPPERELPPEADLSLDELSDKHDYTEAMVVACSSYEGKPVDKILVNGSQHDDPDVLELLTAGYYRIEVFQGMHNQSPAGVIRIVILDPERGNTE